MDGGGGGGRRRMEQEASNGSSNDRRLTTGGSGRQTISAPLHQVLSVNDHNASCKPIRVKAAIRMPGHASPWITFTLPSPPPPPRPRCFHWPANDFRCTMHHGDDGLPFVVAAITAPFLPPPRTSLKILRLSSGRLSRISLGSPLSLINPVFTES